MRHPGESRGDGPREFLRNHQGQITLVLNLLTLGTLAHFRHSRHFGLRPCRAKFICVPIGFYSPVGGGGIVPTSSRQISSMARIMLIGRIENPTWNNPTTRAMGS
jgi:hypothetical protein